MKSRWESCKDAACCFEQILKVAPDKTAIVWSFTSDMTNKRRKLLEEKGQTHKQHSLLDSYTWTHLSRHWVPCVGMDGERKAEEYVLSALFDDDDDDDD